MWRSQVRPQSKGDSKGTAGGGQLSSEVQIPEEMGTLRKKEGFQKPRDFLTNAEPVED